MLFSEQELHSFKKMINSLKRAQRADIFDDENKDIIDKLYVDPLPYFGVREKVASDETVFLIGRKGTGKSTIFAAAQSQIRKRKHELSIYIDVKSLYGRSTAYELGTNITTDKLILTQNFIHEVLKEILIEIDKSLNEKSFMQKLMSKINYDTAKAEIHKQKDTFIKPQFRDITIDTEHSIAQQNCEESSFSSTHGISVGLKDTSISANENVSYADQIKTTDKYKAKLIRDFSMPQYMDNIKTALSNSKIRKLHIFLDDFSELDDTAQAFFVDIILAPLNNWAEKFFRFKVACYPGRIYLGDIDKTKISEEYIDHYDLYKGSKPDLAEIEEKAIEFLDRLLRTRFKYFLNKAPEEIFQTDSKTSWEEYRELLFYATANVPRVMGYLMDSFCDKAIIYDKKVTKTIIANSARDYYENKLRPFFDKATKILETNDNTLDRYGQEKLLNSLIEKSKETRRILAQGNSVSFKKLPTIPTSHFYLPKDYEKYISTLELNYIVTKYFEQSDRDGSKVSIFALNYGLCVDNNIGFGRPKGDRKYYITRAFNYIDVVNNFLKAYKVYVCDNCKHKYEYDDYETVQKANNVCFQGCFQKSTFKELYTFANDIKPKGLQSEKRIPEIQFDVLVTINEIEDPYATSISQELDCSYQMVNAATRKLLAKELITRKQKSVDGKTRNVYALTMEAHDLYLTST